MIWNPSEGIHLGPITLRYYSLMFVVAFGLGWYIMKKIFVRENESIDKLDTLFIWSVLATLVGARLGHVFFYDWPYFRNNIGEILLPVKFEPEFHFTGFTGLASHGAAVSMIIVMYFYSKKIIYKPILWVLDRVVIPVASGAVFVRLGNFFNSEIVGVETTNTTYGIKFIRDYFTPQDVVKRTQIADADKAYDAIVSDPKFINLLNEVPMKHPTQLYEGFCYIFVFLILLFLYWKTKAAEKQGLIFGVFLILLWSVRFVVEYVKGSQGGIEKLTMFNALSTGQWLSIPFVIAGIYFVFRAKRDEITLN